MRKLIVLAALALGMFLIAPSSAQALQPHDSSQTRWNAARRSSAAPIAAATVSS